MASEGTGNFSGSLAKWRYRIIDFCAIQVSPLDRVLNPPNVFAMPSFTVELSFFFFFLFLNNSESFSFNISTVITKLTFYEHLVMLTLRRSHNHDHTVSCRGDQSSKR